jgi:hypothetical protein
VLPQAGEVHKAEIDRLDVFFADEGENFFGSHERSLRTRGEGAQETPRYEAARRAVEMKAGGHD